MAFSSSLASQGEGGGGFLLYPYRYFLLVLLVQFSFFFFFPLICYVNCRSCLNGLHPLYPIPAAAGSFLLIILVSLLRP